jgi:hypothetical protein
MSKVILILIYQSCYSYFVNLRTTSRLLHWPQVWHSNHGGRQAEGWMDHHRRSFQRKAAVHELEHMQVPIKPPEREPDPLHISNGFLMGFKIKLRRVSVPPPTLAFLITSNWLTSWRVAGSRKPSTSTQSSYSLSRSSYKRRKPTRTTIYIYTYIGTHTHTLLLKFIIM